ncbi:hypothetical protein JTB14_004990 [Gonioctena quinquepunctata]|nr:hypothetical protein JTB14_004990 [Gonioctena quinquepunctata]
MKVLLVLSIIISVVEFSNASIDCPEDFCQTVRCAPATRCNEETEIFVKYDNICICCDACYQKLYEGDRCRPITIESGPFMAICVDGLKCDKNGICVKSR